MSYIRHGTWCFALCINIPPSAIAGRSPARARASRRCATSLSISRMRLLALNKPFGTICQFSPHETRPSLARLGRRCPASIRPAGSTPTAKACCCSPTTAHCRRASPSRVTSSSNAIGRKWKARPTRPRCRSSRRGVDLGDYVTRPCRAKYVEPTGRTLWPRNAADSLSRRDTDHLDRTVDHRRQEPAGASHDRRGRLSRRCVWCASASARSTSSRSDCTRARAIELPPRAPWDGIA